MAKRGKGATQPIHHSAPSTLPMPADAHTDADVADACATELPVQAGGENAVVECSPVAVEDWISGASSPHKQEEGDASVVVSHAADANAMCPLCLSIKVHNPVLLHSPSSGKDACVACSECIKQWAGIFLASDDTARACPICAEMVVLPHSEDGVVSSEANNNNNTTIRNPKMDAADEEASASRCGVCEEAAASLTCLQCAFGMCQACQAATHSKGRFREHEVVPMDEARHLGGQRSCHVHASQKLDLFCRGCQACVCVTCCFGGDHRGHDVAPLADMAAEARGRMRHMVSEYTGMSARAAELGSSLTDLSPICKEKVQHVADEVHRTFAALRHALEERETLLTEKLLAMATGVEAAIDSSARDSGALVGMLSRSAQQLEQLVSALNPVVLMSVVPMMDRRHALTTNVAAALMKSTASRQVQLAEDVRVGGVAAFRLFPATEHEAALTEYKELLGQLGHLQAAAELRAVTAVAAHDDVMVQEEEAEAEVGCASMQGGDDTCLQEEAKVGVEELVASPPQPPQALALPKRSLDIDSRRTEAHTVVGDDWLSLALPSSQTSGSGGGDEKTLYGTLSTRKRFLDLAGGSDGARKESPPQKRSRRSGSHNNNNNNNRPALLSDLFLPKRHRSPSSHHQQQQQHQRGANSAKKSNVDNNNNNSEGTALSKGNTSSSSNATLNLKLRI